jgi:hypothetical protein
MQMMVAASHIEFTRAKFRHRTVPGHAVKQFIRTSYFHFRKELITSECARAEQRKWLAPFGNRTRFTRFTVKACKADSVASPLKGSRKSPGAPLVLLQA